MSSNGKNGTAYKIITICIIPVLFFMGKIMYAEGEKWREADDNIVEKVELKIDKTLDKIDRLQSDITSIKVALASITR